MFFRKTDLANRFRMSKNPPKPIFIEIGHLTTIWDQITQYRISTARGPVLLLLFFQLWTATDFTPFIRLGPNFISRGFSWRGIQIWCPFFLKKSIRVVLIGAIS